MIIIFVLRAIREELKAKCSKIFTEFGRRPDTTTQTLRTLYDTVLMTVPKSIKQLASEGTPHLAFTHSAATPSLSSTFLPPTSFAPTFTRPPLFLGEPFEPCRLLQ